MVVALEQIAELAHGHVRRGGDHPRRAAHHVARGFLRRDLRRHDGAHERVQDAFHVARHAARLDVLASGDARGVFVVFFRGFVVVLVRVSPRAVPDAHLLVHAERRGRRLGVSASSQRPAKDAG